MVFGHSCRIAVLAGAVASRRSIDVVVNGRIYCTVTLTLADAVIPASFESAAFTVNTYAPAVVAGVGCGGG